MRVASAAPSERATSAGAAREGRHRNALDGIVLIGSRAKICVVISTEKWPVFVSGLVLQSSSSFEDAAVTGEPIEERSAHLGGRQTRWPTR